MARRSLPQAAMRLGAAMLVFMAVGCGSGHRGDDADGTDDLATPIDSEVDLGTPGADTSDGGSDDGGSDVADDGGVHGINGTATITGVINGYQVMPVRSVVAVVTGQSFEVYISDRANLCTIMQMGSSAKNTSIFRVGATAGAAPHTFPAGTYTYPSGPGSGGGGGNGNGGGGMGGGGGGAMGTRDAVIMSTADNCIYDGYNQASTGSFTINAPVAPDATVIDGTFDITFDVITEMGRFMGSFHAPVCPNATNIPETPTMYCE
jgi:hypothetical protein